MDPEDIIEDIHIQFEALKEFTLKKLTEFKKSTQDQEIKDKDFQKLHKRVRALEERPELAIVDKELEPPVKKVARQLTTKPSFAIPQVLDDLSAEWREKLKGNVATPPKSDLLTEAQLAFFLYWVSKRSNLLANNATVLSLIRDGMEAKVWEKGWSPSPNVSLDTYLMNRLKNVVHKRKKVEAALKIEAEYDSLQKYLDEM